LDIINARRWSPRFWAGVAFVALTAVAASRPVLADEARTAEDEVADHEFALAAPEIGHINRALATEMRRLLGGGSGSPSPEVAKYLDGTSSKGVDLGDTRIPLHTRFIERQRRNFAAGIALAKSATAEHCTDPNPRPEQLLDAALRAQVFAALRCHQQALDRYQSGMHSANQAYEAMLLELKLPPYTRERMLDQAHASTVAQDADLVSSYTNQRKLLQANWDFFTYLDAHAGHAHYVNGQILFDDPADAKALQDLSNRIASATQ
jgi:hypothetical protein